MPSLVAGGALAETSKDLDWLEEDMPLHDKVLVSPDIHTRSTKNTPCHICKHVCCSL